MTGTTGRLSTPLLAALGVVGLTLGGLLADYEPVGGDPDCLYRPIKTELARSLGRGTLPFWSDRFGLGVPLVAESHAAAFYPPNWVAYRALSVPSAYRLAMWLHYLAVAAATFAYARALGLTAWGGSLAGLAFALCGFQASHSSHEPFYHLLPYLPLSLTFAERYLASGRPGWLAGLALVLGAQLTLGHFQIQAWTAGLVGLTALWRVAARQAPWWRGAGLLGALAWAGAVAAAQLVLTRELTQVTGFDRRAEFLMIYAFPPAHWAQLAVPGLFLGLGLRSPCWRAQATSADEACLYVGTVTLVFAGAGWLARRDRGLSLWRWLAPLGLVLATMPRWWPEGFRLLLHLPVLGHFRAPGRYTLLTSLGLCLLAGRGFDRAMPGRRFWPGFALAAAFGGSALGWGWAWSSWPDVRDSLGGARLPLLTAGAVTWLVAMSAVAAWRSGRASPWVPFGVAAVELAYLFHHGTTPWGRSVRFPQDSPAFQALAKEQEVGLVAGDLENVPVRAGLTTAYPNVGIAAPPPNYLLESSQDPGKATYQYLPWLRRFGVTHGVFQGSTPFRPSEVLYQGRDPALDVLLLTTSGPPPGQPWRVERYPDAFPAAWVGLRVREAKDWYEMYPALSNADAADEVWFLRADRPPAPPGPRARSARVVRWDGRSGEVEHDGTCDLILRRTYYPGWAARVDGKPAPIVPADGGLQSIRLAGAGVSRVEVSYRPVGLRRAVGVSLAAVAAALAVLGWEAARARRLKARPS